MKVIPPTVLAISVVLSGCRAPRSQGDALSRAEFSMDDVATLPKRHVEARLPKSHGAVYYGKRRDRFLILTVTASEAMALGISDGNCDSAEALVKTITEK